jgi:TPP-dependent pyruvate/acetoin dehydrogenase alpha subunit
VEVALTLRVNGEPRDVVAPVHKALLEVLREDLGLTGAKHGCELGGCGTCTVLLDGMPVLSCLTLPVEVQDREITAIEGLAQGGTPHPLQVPFAELGAPSLGILPFISHMAASVPVAAGMALACRQRGEARVVLTFFGDGATSTGAWHEGVNVAALFRLPLVLVLENNQCAYSTPLDRQTAARSFTDKAPGDGVPDVSVDGNDVLAVYAAACEAVARARRGEGPTLIECVTMRVRGHSEADRFAYVPKELLEEWAARDPIARLERRLRDEGCLTAESDRAMQERTAREVEDGLAWAEASPEPTPESAADGVYAEDAGP